mmetsp:Transcript_34212/g.88837  ORF Transcript_34212/g.88837 Transcript_34212/m.88837 type:complete len:227 (-) Transcript_34212:234-914(-)
MKPFPSPTEPRLVVLSIHQRPEAFWYIQCRAIKMRADGRCAMVPCGPQRKVHPRPDVSWSLPQGLVIHFRRKRTIDTSGGVPAARPCVSFHEVRVRVGKALRQDGAPHRHFPRPADQRGGRSGRPDPRHAPVGDVDVEPHQPFVVRQGSECGVGDQKGDRHAGLAQQDPAGRQAQRDGEPELEGQCAPPQRGARDRRADGQPGHQHATHREAARFGSRWGDRLGHR